MAKHTVTNRPMTLHVDISITDKTNLERLDRDIIRQLERIIGVTVRDVERTR